MVKRKKQASTIYLDHIEIPVFKEKFSLVFAKGGPYQAIKKLKLLHNYANTFHDGDVKEATNDLQNSNATVIYGLDNMTIMILPFDVSRGVIAHEIFHLAKLVMDKRGVTFSNSSEEAYAHLIDWLTDEIYKYWDAIPKPKRK